MAQRSRQNVHFAVLLRYARRTVKRCRHRRPVRHGARWRVGRRCTVRSPIDGSTLAEFPLRHAEQVGRGHRTAAATHFPTWRDTPAPVRGELVRRIGNAFREHQDELATLVTWEAGKIPRRGTRRSAGNHRHLRLRRRPEPATLRQDNRQRAARSPADRILASARSGRRDLGIQFPSRGLGMERDDRPRVRRSDRVEAVGENAAVARSHARHSCNK